MSVPSPPLSALEAVPAEGWRGCPLFSLDNLYRAWRRCRRGKRRTHNALAFEADLEAQLLALRDELMSGTWRPCPPLAFLVERPKRREVFAADFRDRVVHHVLVEHLEPGWERRFIHDSYACRVDKGTHAAVDRLRQFCRRATANGTRPAWYLQLDVQGFFVTLDRRILWARLAAHERDPAVRWLMQVILHHEPTEACRLRGHPRAVFAALPAHKTLFRARPGCGLPIGNLTSQFFANVYLDALDQFIKHQLKAHCYLRYCDDLVLVSADRAQLVAWEGRIAAFLAEVLHLRLNARRRLQPVANGIDFLGYIVRPDYLLVRRRVVGALRDRLNQAERELQRAGWFAGRGEALSLAAGAAGPARPAIAIVLGAPGPRPDPPVAGSAVAALSLAGGILRPPRRTTGTAGSRPPSGHPLPGTNRSLSESVAGARTPGPAGPVLGPVPAAASGGAVPCCAPRLDR